MDCFRGVYFSKIGRIGWLGKKYNDLLRKDANTYTGEEVKKAEKGEILNVLGGKKYHILKKVGGGAKISYFGQIYTPGLL